MSGFLQIATNEIIGFLNQQQSVQFTNIELYNLLEISKSRLSDVLNVLYGACIITRQRRIFAWKRCDIQQAFAQFVFHVDSNGTDTSIYQHTKTVVFKIKQGRQLEKDKRTYDVLSVLKALNVIIFRQKWEFTTILAKPILLTLTVSQEKDTEVISQDLSYE